MKHSSDTKRSGIVSLLVLVGFLLLTSAAAVGGSLFPPDIWYAELRKPPLQPPNWIFAPVWTLLYLLIAVAGWLLWRTSHPLRRQALGAWTVQLALNAAWSPIFFGLHSLGWALVVLAALWGVLVAMVWLASRTLPLAGKLLLPYLAWVSFALYLNTALAWLN